MLPNFVIIGAAKAGTTSLYHYIRSHPQAFMPAKKELSFFCEEYRWGRGVEWYASQFDSAGDAVAVGEASPRYTVYPILSGVPARMASVIPDARLIYLVREPIGRMQSHYLDRVIHGIERRPVEEALLSDDFYLAGSRYALQIEQYLPFFPREHLLVLRTEDLASQRRAVLNRVFGFLCIDPDWHDPILDREFLRTIERNRPRAPIRHLWYSPKIAWSRRLVPEPVKHAIRRAATSRIDPKRAEIPASLRRHLQGALRSDVERLYEFLEPFDGWGIA